MAALTFHFADAVLPAVVNHDIDFSRMNGGAKLTFYISVISFIEVIFLSVYAIGIDVNARYPRV